VFTKCSHVGLEPPDNGESLLALSLGGLAIGMKDAQQKFVVFLAEVRRDALGLEVVVLDGLKRGLDGNLYYLTFTSPTTRVNTIRRIRYVTPANAAPARNYFTTDTPTLTWNRVTFAHHYVLQVGKTNDFMGATAYQAGNNLSYTLPSLPDGYYYWRVAACSSIVTCGSWSAIDTFVVDAP